MENGVADLPDINSSVQCPKAAKAITWRKKQQEKLTWKRGNQNSMAEKQSASSWRWQKSVQSKLKVSWGK